MQQEKQTIMETVKHYLNAYADKNLADCMKYISEESPILMLGTNEDEVISDRAALEKAYQRDFSLMNRINFGEFRNQYIETNGRLASVLVELSTSFESQGKITQTIVRYALTLTQEADQWKICAGMTSVPFKSGTYSF